MLAVQADHPTHCPTSLLSSHCPTCSTLRIGQPITDQNFQLLRSAMQGDSRLLEQHTIRVRITMPP